MLTTKNSAALLSFLMALVGLASLTACAPAGTRALRDGDRLMAQGKWTEAVEKLRIAVQTIPEAFQARAWNHLGLAYHRAGRVSEALVAYQQAVNRDQNLAIARYNRGCLYLEQTNLIAAIADFSLYSVLERRAPAGWLRLGTAYLRAHQLEAAEKNFQAALELNASIPEALNGLGVIQLQRRRLREAFSYFTAALQQQSDYAPALFNLAVIYHQHLNNRALALQKYSAYVRLTPPPSNAAAVRETIRALEIELNPPRIAITNPLPVAPTISHPARTNQPPSPASVAPASPTSGRDGQTKSNSVAGISKPEIQRITNPPAVSAQIKTNIPSPTVAARLANSTKSANTPPPKEAPPKFEVVQLKEEPPPKPAQDTLLNRTLGATNDTASAVTNYADAVIQAITSSASPQILPAPSDKAPQDKKGLLERLNPMTWWPRKNTSAPAPVAAPSTSNASKSATPIRPATSGSTGDSPVATPLPVARAWPRFRYLEPAKPTPGDRRQAEPWFTQGLKAHRERRLTAAMHDYGEALKRDPSFFEACYNLGLAAYDLRDTSQSLSAYQIALSINPTSADARYNFALALQLGKYPRDAADELERLLGDRPEESRAHFTLAKLYAEQLDRVDLARQHYRKVLELDPGHQQAAAIRGWLAAHP